MRPRLTLGRFVALLILLSLAGSAWAILQGRRFFDDQFPRVDQLKTLFPVVHYQGKGKPSKVVLQKKRPDGWASLSEVSRVAVGAIVVSEDWAFYQHRGYDPNQIKEAIRHDLKQKRFARGASTLTQQVVRNVFLTKEKTLWRKVKELVLSVELEREVGKKRILETYLNIAEWGEGIHGIRRAAIHYFGKPPGELSAREGAFLAMLLPSPKKYSASFRDRKLTAFARRTVDSILNKMVQAQYLSPDERDRELTERLSFEVHVGGERRREQPDEGPEPPGELEGELEDELESEGDLGASLDRSVANGSEF